MKTIQKVPKLGVIRQNFIASKFLFKSSLLFEVALTILFIFSGCSDKSYELIPDGAIIHLNGEDGNAKKLKIQVITDEIIRVSAIPEGQFPDRKSLSVIYKSETLPPFTLTENEGNIEIRTAKLIVMVNEKTGAVAFTDLEGNALLRECPDNCRKFEPITVDNTTGYTITQKFESPNDEAIFGLGQHQSDEWNYKNKSEVLYQYNTKVSVPFYVSNKKYGILWDNYSLTKFGDIRDYEQVSQFKLYNKQGESGGLTATYTTADGKIFDQRTESTIDYENLETVKNFPENFPFYNANIVWEGEIEAAEAGEFAFKLYYAGYTKVFMNSTEVVAERWRTSWNPNTYKFTCKLEANKRVPVRIEWKPDGGVSYLSFKALSPMPQSETDKRTVWSEMGQELDYYFVYGETPDKIIAGYRLLTGKAPILPNWAYGFWQSRERYKTQDELVGTLNEFRKRNIGIDNIVMDWFYWEKDQWGSHEFDKTRFPEPKKMMNDIHALNANIMISVWPKFYINTEHFKEFNDKGLMYRQAVEDSIRDWVAPGYIGSFYDAYSAEGRTMFWNQINEHLYSLGIDAWWMDASEPDINSNESMDYRKKLSGPTALGSSTEFFNTYALVNADAIYNGQRSVDKNKRVFLLTRSGFAGLQRYSTATWSGDIGTRWEDMKSQISAGLNFALSGLPYWTMDIGGFCVEKRYENAKEGTEDMNEWRELQTRWYQFGTFAPLYRAHGQFPFREVFNIAPEKHPAYQSIVYYNKLRYSLMPYIYSLAAKVHFDDYTMMRALFMDFATDVEALKIQDQFMFGSSLMVCPVYQYKAREREVYFPASAGWYDLYSGKYIRGAQTLKVAAPYERMPMYVKAGSIIPVGAYIQFVSEKPDAPISLYVYAGANGEFTLYNDEGTNFNYEKGEFSKITITYFDESKTLVIEDRKGEYAGMPKVREFNIVYVTSDKPKSFNSANNEFITVKYKGKQIKINL